MHTNSYSQLNESVETVPSRKTTVKISASRKTTRNVKLPTINPPPGLPVELEDYLTTTDQPHEVFTLIQDSRDRRIRLLLRRFTNQIQYGCMNPHCSIATCLSYRKRHATTPVRPYTDIVARALAYRCVEQYADAGKEQNWSERNFTARKGKTKILYEDVAGLCWNDPVVPWYEDPKEVGRRSRASVVKEVSGRNGSRYDPHLKDISHIDEQDKQSKDIPAEPDTITTQYNSVTDAHDTPTAMTKSESITRHGVNKGLQHAHSNADQSAKKQRQVLFVEPPDSHDHQDYSHIKDTASFTQTLYNTSPVKAIDHVKSYNGGETNACDNHDISVSNVDEPKTSLGVSTFKLLPLSTILWLRTTMPSNANIKDLNTTPDHGEYSLFARQSLYYCLTRPTTLLESAYLWHLVHPQPQSLEENMRKRLIKHLALKEKLTKNSPQVTQLPAVGGIMIAVGMLIAITSIPEVLNHLFAALQHAYILPPWLIHIQNKSASSSKNRVSSSSNTPKNGGEKDTKEHGSDFLEDAKVAQICMLIVTTLCLLRPLKQHRFTLANFKPLESFEEQYWASRKSGVVFPFSTLSKAWSKKSEIRPNVHAYVSRLDTMDDWYVQRLLDELADVISHRLAVTETRKANITCSETEKSKNVIDAFMDDMLKAPKTRDPAIHWRTMQINFLDLLRSIILRRWNREAIIKRRGPVGGALELLAAMYRKRNELGIPTSEFQWGFIGNSFDEIDMPIQWLSFRADNVQTHMLSYSFLFEPACLVIYFRAINSIIMKRAHESASAVLRNAQQALRGMPITVYGSEEILAQTRPNMAQFFVLTIRRDNILQDAMNQIWRRQRQEMMRPLKVRLGMNEGEDGLDHGGVQAEFFRMVFADALDPKYGMFTIDENTRTSWFQPGSLEPLHKFEALGILMSLAVYNGITLPITFPIAFYRKILGLKVKTLPQIEDGWPDLARGLQQLLDWSDGDVGDVISRTYEFSYEAFGKSFTVDMTKAGLNNDRSLLGRRILKDKLKTPSPQFSSGHSPTPPSEGSSSLHQMDPNILSAASPTKMFVSTPLSLSSATTSIQESEQLDDTDAPLVTNLTRDQYVKDYIWWLVNRSIVSQFESFATGFYTCLDRTALSIFTPEHLKTVIEGHQDVDIDGLQATTTYDEYRSTDDIIQWFWDVVREMSSDQHKKLLEFVTASDRVPVNGIDSVVFIIQRNGDSDERLPSSSTCYGRLLLPKYSTKQILKEKLEKAIENSIGFGSL